MFAYIDENNICRGISIIESDIYCIPVEENVIGKKYENNKWVDPNQPQPYEPTNAEIAQLISDLQAEIEIRGL